MTHQGQFGGQLDDVKKKKLARRLLEERSVRAEFFPVGMFGETAWDALLVLFSHDHSSTLTAADIAARVAETVSVTGQWLHFLDQHAFTESRIDLLDPRRRIAELTTTGREMISAYLATIDAVQRR